MHQKIQLMKSTIPNVLVTGGAGYIGAHVVNQLIKHQFKVTVIDDLSTGHVEFVNKDAEFIKGSILNTAFLHNVFQEKKNDQFIGVIHLAGIKYASESVKEPDKFYEVNSSGTLNIVSKMITHGVRNLIFASSCSIYGQPVMDKAVTENSPLLPISPYGKSKALAESIINSAVTFGDLNAVSLRYFNVIGSALKDVLDLSRFNLLPNIYRSITEASPLTIYGDNFKTPDQTAIRDYVEVGAIAEMHVQCLIKLISGVKLKTSYNLGSEKEISINQIVSVTRDLISPFDVRYFKARPGDPERISANCLSAKLDLDWKHDASLEMMVLSGWNAWSSFHNQQKAFERQ